MRSITLYVETGFVGGEYNETIEVPDDTTDEELMEIAQEFMQEYVSYGWTENQGVDNPHRMWYNINRIKDMGRQLSGRAAGI